MTTPTNLYANSILEHHPTAIWTLDDTLEEADTAILDDFFNDGKYYVSSVSRNTPTSTIDTFVLSSSTIPSWMYEGATVKVVDSDGIQYSQYPGRYKIVSVNYGGHSVQVEVGGGSFVAPTNFVNLMKAHDGKVLSAYNSDQYHAFTYAKEEYTYREDIFKTGIPLVYGSNGSRSGAIIIPSLDMFSYYGKFNNYTFEFWTRIKKPEKNAMYRIFGHFANGNDMYEGGSNYFKDGLYFNDDSFVLSIGGTIGKAYIKEFDKPMFIQLLYSPRSVSLVVNTEKLITINLSEQNLEALEKHTKSINRDYVVLDYATFDAIAIYPYISTPSQSKARYAFGQAVKVPETINARYGTGSVSIDFKSAQYAANFKYPIDAEWKSGVSSNINILDYGISNYQYSHPKINTTRTDFKEWNMITNDSYSIDSVNYVPTFNAKYDKNIYTNFEFGSINILNEKVAAFYLDGFRLSTHLPGEEETVFKIINKYDRNYFRIGLQKTDTDTFLKFYIKYNTKTETEIVDARITNPHVVNLPNDEFIIGIEIEKFAKTFGNNLSTFFSKRDQLVFFALGDNDIDVGNTLDMNVMSINFLTSEDMNKKQSMLERDSLSGILLATGNSCIYGTQENKQRLLPSAYMYHPMKEITRYFSSIEAPTGDISRMTVGTYGYWKNDLPLSRLMKSLDGTSSEKIDYIQYNVDYNSPVSKIDSSYMNTYNILGGTEKQKSVRTYVTFEPVSGMYKADADFTTIAKMPKDRVIKPGSSWATTKYEVVDGSIIYMPDTDLKNLSLVFHVDFNVHDTYYRAVEVKTLEVASQSLYVNKNTPVSTKYGKNITPYVYTVVDGNRVYKYDGYNPILIDKKTTPHLHLEKTSGIRMVGFDKPVSGENRGLAITVNDNKDLAFRLSSMQMFINYEAFMDGDNPMYSSNSYNPIAVGAPFPSSSSVDLISVKTKTKTITFKAVPTNTYDYVAGEETPGDISKRFKIMAYNDKTSIIDENIVYYVNGVEQATPLLSTNEWVSIGIAFTEPLNFDGMVGTFEFVSPMAFDNVSFYQYTNRQIRDNTIAMPWDDVLSAPGAEIDYTWDFWKSNKWVDMLTYINPNKSAIDISDVYNMYTGRNISSPIMDGKYKAKILNPSYAWYDNYSSSKYTYTPV